MLNMLEVHPKLLTLAAGLEIQGWDDHQGKWVLRGDKGRILTGCWGWGWSEPPAHQKCLLIEWWDVSQLR